MNLRLNIAKGLQRLSKRIASGNYRSSAFSDDAYYELSGGAIDEYSKYDSIARGDLRTYLELYQKLLSVYKGVHTIATSAASVPIKVWRPSGINAREEFKIHPINNLLGNANNLNTRYELFTKTFAYLELTGNCYWFLEREEGMPVKIHVPRPDYVEPKRVGINDKDIQYDRRKGKHGHVEHWHADDVVHFTHFNPLSDIVGFPPVAAGQDNAIIELAQVKFGKVFFQNSIYPGSVFGTSGHLSDVAYERFKADLRRQHIGVDFFHRVLLLEEDIKPLEDHKKNPTDTEYIENRKMSVEDIWMLLGCYHLVTLKQGRAGIALQESRRLFWEEIVTRLMNVAGTIEKELLRQYPNSEELTVEFDVRKVPGLRDSMLEESLANTRYLQAGVKTINEVRAEIGIDKDLPWGDEPAPTLGLAHSRASRAGLPNEERAAYEETMPHPEVEDTDAFARRITQNVMSKIAGNGTEELDNDHLYELISAAVNENRSLYV